MALIKWKQISGQLGDYGNLTGSLNISGGLSINGEEVGATSTTASHALFAVSASYAISAITAVIAGDGLSGGATSGSATVTLNTGSAHFISGAIDLAVFKQTGSYYSTTNNLHITGGLQLNASESGDVFSIFSASVKTVSINQQGVLQLISQSSTPTPVAGGLYLDTNYDLYIGQE